MAIYKHWQAKLLTQCPLAASHTSSKHKDSEIAELEHILFFFRICESDTPTNKQILLPRALRINTETYSPKYF